MKRSRLKIVVVMAALATVFSDPSNRSGAGAQAETRIAIGVTETMDTFNTYGDSVALMYSVWCQDSNAQCRRVSR
jgi:hypothetical protein